MTKNINLKKNISNKLYGKRKILTKNQKNQTLPSKNSKQNPQ